MEHELSGRYPILIDGNETGAVTVSREGVFWRFEARCALQEELLRLSVYGEGKEGYLGVMEPIGGELCLTKKLSRSGVSGFPSAISYATRAGEAPPLLKSEAEAEPEACEEASAAAESAGEEAESAEAESGCDLPAEDDKPPPEISGTAQDGEPWRFCPCPCSLFAGLGAKAVCSSITGALTKRAGGSLLLAVPEETAILLPQNNILTFTQTESIFGRRYLLAEI